jgi:hypothetical protein
MKLIKFKRKSDPLKGVKALTLSQKSEDKECVSFVRKHFTYNVSKTEKDIKTDIEAPEIFIKKAFDTKRGIERFNFEVIGAFFMAHGRFLFKVDFHHTLRIQIHWKTKVFSPKKSEILTK